MPVRAFVAVNVAGTLFRLWLIRRFGEAFESPIDDIVGWIGDNRAILLVISIGLVLISIALEAKRGETEVTALAHLDDHLDREGEEGGGDREPDTDGDGDGGHREPDTEGDGDGGHREPGGGPTG
jgi:hypothetical protein